MAYSTWKFRSSGGPGATDNNPYSSYVLRNTRGRSPRRRIQRDLLPKHTPSGWDSQLILKYNYDGAHTSMKRLEALRTEIFESAGIYISDTELIRLMHNTNEEEVAHIFTTDQLLRYFRPAKQTKSEAGNQSSRSSSKSVFPTHRSMSATSQLQEPYRLPRLGALESGRRTYPPGVPGTATGRHTAQPLDMTRSLGCQLAESSLPMSTVCGQIWAAVQPAYPSYVLKNTNGSAPLREAYTGLFPTVRINAGNFSNNDSALINKHSDMCLA